MQINRKAGLASNYDCGQCACPYNYTPSLNEMYPTSVDVGVGSEVNFEFEAGYQDCNYMDYWYNYTPSAYWTSGSPSIASIQGAGLVKGVSAGTASISASYSGYTYTFNGSYCNQSTPLYGGASGTTWVHSVQVTSVSLSSDQVTVTLTDPLGASGQLAVSWTGPGGNANIASGSYAPGTFTCNPTLSNLATGQYTGVSASWTVSGSQATGSFTINFYVLGSYTQSQYNTPAESQCTGSTGPGFVYPSGEPIFCG
jgi:hypothetical protein